MQPSTPLVRLPATHRIRIRQNCIDRGRRPVRGDGLLRHDVDLDDLGGAREEQHEDWSRRQSQRGARGGHALADRGTGTPRYRCRWRARCIAAGLLPRATVWRRRRATVPRMRCALPRARPGGGTVAACRGRHRAPSSTRHHRGAQQGLPAQFDERSRRSSWRGRGGGRVPRA